MFLPRRLRDGTVLTQDTLWAALGRPFNFDFSAAVRTRGIPTEDTTNGTPFVASDSGRITVSSGNPCPGFFFACRRARHEMVD